MKDGRDVWYHDAAEGQSDDCPAEELDAEDMLSSSTPVALPASPKGIMHTQGGYQVYTYLTAKYVFDMGMSDISTGAADVGWITGHSYLIYG